MKFEKKQKLLNLIIELQTEIMRLYQAKPMCSLDSIIDELNRSYEGLKNKHAETINNYMQSNLLQRLVELSSQVEKLSEPLNHIYSQILYFFNNFSREIKNDNAQKFSFHSQVVNSSNTSLRKLHASDLLHPNIQDAYDFKVISLLNRQFLQ